MGDHFSGCDLIAISVSSSTSFYSFFHVAGNRKCIFPKYGGHANVETYIGHLGGIYTCTGHLLVYRLPGHCTRTKCKYG